MSEFNAQGDADSAMIVRTLIEKQLKYKEWQQASAELAPDLTEESQALLNNIPVDGTDPMIKVVSFVE